MNKKEVMTKYVELHELYKDTNRVDEIRKIEALLLEDKLEEAGELMKNLPDKSALQERIYVHLQGKPVYDTLKKVLAGKCTNLYEGLKGLFSLGTHISIEMEKGHMEYKVLLDETLSAIHNYMK